MVVDVSVNEEGLVIGDLKGTEQGRSRNDLRTRGEGGVSVVHEGLISGLSLHPKPPVPQWDGIGPQGQVLYHGGPVPVCSVPLVAGVGVKWVNVIDTSEMTCPPTDERFALHVLQSRDQVEHVSGQAGWAGVATPGEAIQPQQVSRIDRNVSNPVFHISSAGGQKKSG